MRKLKKNRGKATTLLLTRPIIASFAYCGQSYIIFCAAATLGGCSTVHVQSSLHHAKGAIPQVGRLGKSKQQTCDKGNQVSPGVWLASQENIRDRSGYVFLFPSASTGNSINLLIVLNIFCRINKLQWEHQHAICVFSCLSLQC